MRVFVVLCRQAKSLPILLSHNFWVITTHSVYYSPAEATGSQKHLNVLYSSNVGTKCRCDGFRQTSRNQFWNKVSPYYLSNWTHGKYQISDNWEREHNRKYVAYSKCVSCRRAISRTRLPKWTITGRYSLWLVPTEEELKYPYYRSLLMNIHWDTHYWDVHRDSTC